MVGFIMLISIFIILIVISVVFLIQGSGDGSGWIIVFSLILILVCINNKSVKYSEPEVIPHSELSILIDDDVAIVRYKGLVNMYKDVQKYKAISNGKFTYTVVREQNILGEDNGTTHELKLTK